jgi:hypothetical protein
MRIDFAKLKAAGFNIQQDEEGIDISLILPLGSSKLHDILSSYAHTPMGKDLIVGSTFDAIAKAKFLETL